MIAASNAQALWSNPGMTAELTVYERAQLAQLRRWQAEPPGPATRLFGKAAGPASKAVQSMLPEAALRSALAGAQKAALKLTGEDSLLRKAGVKSFEELRGISLQTCDRLATEVQRRAMAMAGGAGAVFGVAGTAGLVADVPALLVLALRSIHRTGLCYGESGEGDEARARLGIGIFALASANTVEEKQAALAALRNVHAEQSTAAWRDGVERAAERELAKEAAVFGLNNLARSLGTNLGWRKAAGAMPVLGAVVGGSVNAWYLYDVTTVARYVFQERWLRAKQPAALAAAPNMLPGPPR